MFLCIDIEGCRTEHYDDCADVTIEMETDDSTAVQSADNELADIDGKDAAMVKLEPENGAIIEPVSEVQQPQDTGNQFLKHGRVLHSTSTRWKGTAFWQNA